MQWLPPAPWLGWGQAQSPHPGPPPASSCSPPQAFALGGSNNGVHPHSLSGHPFLPWHQSHFSFVPTLPSLPLSQLFPEQYDRQMKGNFSPSHGGMFGRKDPFFSPPLCPLAWFCAAGQGTTSLIALTPRILSTRYCSLPCPQPSICLSIPLGSTTRSHSHDAVQGSFL